MWFGSGHAPVKLKPIVEKDGSTTEQELEERLRTVVHGAIAALPRKFRPQAEAQFQSGTLETLTEAMAAWIYGGKMDAASFAHHFFDRDADDPVVASLRAAVSETVEAETRPQLAAASGHLADAIKTVGVDNWPRFVADARRRAHFKATLAAIEKSRQPPDLHRDAIRPVYPIENALAAGAAAMTGGISGVAGAVARDIVGAVASKSLADKPAPSAGKQTAPQTAANGAEQPEASVSTRQTSSSSSTTNSADAVTIQQAAAALPAGMSQAAFGRLAGFTQGQEASSAASTEATEEVIARLRSAGVSREAISLFQQFYAAVARVRPSNSAAVHRAALLKSILETYR